jgi:type I restriction enzyme, S subunit
MDEVMKYEKYKPSGIDWIGDVPDHWSIKRLKDLSKINPTKSELNYEKVKDVEVVFLPMENVFESGEIDNSEKKPCRDLWEGFTYFQKNDVIIAKITPCFENEKGAWLNNLDSDFGFGSTEFHVVRGLKNKLDSEFFYFLSKSDVFMKLGEALMTGTAGQKRVSTEFIQTFKFSAAPYREQLRIAQYLREQTQKLDTLIANKKAQVEKLKELRQIEINNTVTKGLDKNVELKESGIDWLGKIPKHWKVKRLKDYTTKIGSGVTPKGGADVYEESGVPLFRSQNIHFDGLRLDDVAYITNDVHQSMSGSRVEKNDVLLNITGASIGRCYFYDGSLGEANVNQHVCVIRTNAKLNYRFLQFYISSDSGQSQVFLGQVGTSREGLTFQDIKHMTLGVPEVNEQEAIVKHLECKTRGIDRLLKNTEQQIEKLIELRKIKIYEAVTGKIKVPAYEQAIA